ncbi:response regulator transcription factor [Amycolatopsis dongchuanensis]|uniref:Response regulator transcription factor n=1 Tax=Amycolatopsis dongchuanensis TaxID=1070866 RepID=A0ABP9QT81_9PSEU
MTGVRVLIADDQEAVRRNLRRILEAEPDLRVIGEAADGAAAIERARVLQPDVVLVDVRMPGLDGLAVTRALAGPDVEQPLRVVVITTFELDEYVYGAIRNGAAGFLLKRSGPTLLVEGVRAAVSGDMLISPEVTVQLLRHLTTLTPAAVPTEPLTARELAVASLVAEAKTNLEIAAELSISVGTVKSHLMHVQRKLRLRNRVAVAAWVWESGRKGR